MKKLIFIFILSIGNISAQISEKIKPVECKMWRGARNEAKFITLHDNYSLLIPFDSLNAYLVADHGGKAGFPGTGYKYMIFVYDSKVRGYVQGASSSTLKLPLALQDVSFDDNKYQIRVRCRGRKI
jgi:hypothetical protein